MSTISIPLRAIARMRSSTSQPKLLRLTTSSRSIHILPPLHSLPLNSGRRRPGTLSKPSRPSPSFCRNIFIQTESTPNADVGYLCSLSSTSTKGLFLSCFHLNYKLTVMCLTLGSQVPSQSPHTPRRPEHSIPRVLVTARHTRPPIPFTAGRTTSSRRWCQCRFLRPGLHHRDQDTRHRVGARQA